MYIMIPLNSAKSTEALQMAFSYAELEKILEKRNWQPNAS